MKKNWKKFLAGAMAGLLTAAAAAPALALPVYADEESTESYRVFLAFGGDAAEEGDWGYSYAGGDASEGITVTDGEIKSGETTRIGLEFANPVVNAWYFAPTMIMDNTDYLSEAEFEVKAFIDGNEVDVDMSAGDNNWVEDTGDFTKAQALRIGGGFNEWGTQYMSEPSGFTKLEFEITAKSIKVLDEDEKAILGALDSLATYFENLHESEDEYDLYLAFGGDAAEEGDWGYSFAGGDASEGMTVTNGKLKVGETSSVKIEFANPVVNAWYFAPFFVMEDTTKLQSADFEVKAFIDGNEVDVDMSAGDNYWTEDTGDYTAAQAVRIGGGFNEWGTQYMAEPSGFTSIEFQITANSIMLGDPIEGMDDAAASSAGEVDLDGSYNAYIGIQTPAYSFRNRWDDATYGLGTDFFNQVTGWEGNDPIVHPGSFTDAVIAGNGTYTVSADNLELPSSDFESQDYMNLIFVSTDIPRTDAITISDVVLDIDGMQPSINPMISPEDDDQYLTIFIQNIWNPDITTIGYYAVPPKNIKITFTVSGFNYDNPDATGAVEEEVVEEVAEEPAEEPAPAEEVAEEPAEEPAPAEAPAQEGGFPVWIIILIVVVVVVAGGIVGYVVYNNSKKNGGSGK